MNKPRFYFAHAVNTYNTPLESAVVDLICYSLNCKVENPNQPQHQAGYAAYAKRVKESGTQHKGMNYFYDEVLPHCDGCVSMPFLDGRMGLGVAGETKWFVEHGKPAWFVQPTVTPRKEDLSVFLWKLHTFIGGPRSGLFVVRQFNSEEAELILKNDPTLVVPHEETRLRTFGVYGHEPRAYETAHLVSMPIPIWFYPDKIQEAMEVQKALEAQKSSAAS